MIGTNAKSTATEKKWYLRKVISLLLKAVVICFALAGTILSMQKGNDEFMGGATTLMYFTIQSNLAIALICAVGMFFFLSGNIIPSWWYTIKYVGTIVITLTGAVFCFVLAPTMPDTAWVPANIFTHVIVPISSVIDFFIIGVDSDIKKWKVIYVPLPPLAYVIFASVAFINNWQFARGVNYPYFFLNWGSPAGAFGFSDELPFMGCVWWILLLLIALIFVGLLYLWILDGLKRLLKKQ